MKQRGLVALVCGLLLCGCHGRQEPTAPAPSPAELLVVETTPYDGPDSTYYPSCPPPPNGGTHSGYIKNIGGSRTYIWNIAGCCAVGYWPWCDLGVYAPPGWVDPGQTVYWSLMTLDRMCCARFDSIIVISSSQGSTF